MSLSNELSQINGIELMDATCAVIERICGLSLDEARRTVGDQHDNYPALSELRAVAANFIRRSFPDEEHAAGLTGVNVVILALSEFALAQKMREEFPDAPMLPKDSQG